MATIEAKLSIKELELAGFASWPAEQVIEDGSWLIRLSSKLPYKRTNSINCLSESDGDNVTERLQKAQSVFESVGVQPTLRTTPLTPPSLLSATSGLRWGEPFSESIVMTAALAEDMNADPNHAHAEFESFDHPAIEWIDDYMALTMDKAKDRDTITRTLNQIEKPVQFIRVIHNSSCIGVAVSVVQNNLVGLFGLAVAASARRQGLGRVLSKTALNWGKNEGASTAWLQVEADNTPARKLYESLGFVECYRYAYRSLKA